MGPAGMHSFGHAAYFGLGAYGAALLVRAAACRWKLALLLAPLVAALGALVFGWFCVRLSGVYLAMLTLAFAQIIWSIVFQWDDFTGGSNGLTGVWPAAWLADKRAYYYLTLAAGRRRRAVAAARAVLAVRLCAARRPRFAAARRCDRHRRQAHAVGGLRDRGRGFAGLAGALYAFSKGSISPDTLSVGRSVDGLVMVLLGGIQTLAGPIVGAVTFTWLHDTVARNTDYWRAAARRHHPAAGAAVPAGHRRLRQAAVRAQRRIEPAVELEEAKA